ncbi:MAG: exodeoxyribonuclease VII small subunit [Adlercreutzia equolifaciens]
MEELTFREALSELESIVSVLESNTLELEESLAAYERGVVLLGSLQKRLGAAEQQVEVLMGELVAAPTTRPRTRPSPRTVTARQIP